MTAPVPPAPRFPVWNFVARVSPLVLLWAALVAWLVYLLYSQAQWSRRSDEADVREWLSQTRPASKYLSDLLKEYLDVLDDPKAPPEERLTKYDEVEEHLRALVEPTRAYADRLPLFPVVYALTVECPGVPHPSQRTAHPYWVSPLPAAGRRLQPGRSDAPAGDGPTGIRVLDYAPDRLGGRVVIRCEYRLHTYNRFEQDQQDQKSWQLPLVYFLAPAVFLAGGIFVLYLRRDRARELARWQAVVAAQQNEQEALAAEVKRQEAEREKQKAELTRRMLEQELAAVNAQTEAAAAEMRSQVFAGIGIMAGSYAHNIKNLLVRPNDLLTRCIEADGMSADQQGMLAEVKTTLGTVTQRLQEILQTIRRDPGTAQMSRIDLAAVVRDTLRTWAEIAREKWKIRLTAAVADPPLWIAGDLSHLQQAIENLVFNARDATFEMRNHVRDEARSGPPGTDRNRRILDAAAWKGEVTLVARRDGPTAVLEVRDNGIGMTDEVKRDCLKTHFTTKRDNAAFAGMSAGMGLGLSFVAVVLEHHKAALDIDTAPRRGATFRVRLPLIEE